MRFEDVKPGVRIHPVITTGALSSTGARHMAGQDVGTASGTTVTDKLGNRLRVSPHVPAYASDYQEAVVCKGSAFQAVCAIWQGVAIVVSQRL